MFILQIVSTMDLYREKEISVANLESEFKMIKITVLSQRAAFQIKSNILDPYALFIQSKSLYRFVELISLNYYIKIYQDIYRHGQS